MNKPLTSTKDKKKRLTRDERLTIEIGALSMTAFGMETGFEMFKRLKKAKAKTEC